jgi:hypothetical protein
MGQLVPLHCGNPRDADAGTMLFSTQRISGGNGGGGGGTFTVFTDPAPALAAGDGTYSFAVTLTTVGNHTLTASFLGGTVGNTPTVLRVFPAGESAASSFATHGGAVQLLNAVDP